MNRCRTQEHRKLQEQRPETRMGRSREEDCPMQALPGIHTLSEKEEEKGLPIQMCTVEGRGGRAVTRTLHVAGKPGAAATAARRRPALPGTGSGDRPPPRQANKRAASDRR